jgi:hypothetical protein
MMQIFHHGSPSENLSRLVSLANCVGIMSKFFEVQSPAAFVSALRRVISLQKEMVVFDVESLKRVCSQEDLDAVAAIVFNHTIFVLLLVTAVDDDTNRFLRVLTKEGVLRGGLMDKATRINFSSEASGLVGELANQSYLRRPIEAIGLTLDSRPEVECIMRLNDSPTFARVQAGEASVFIWSSFRIFDVSRPLSAEREFEEAVDEYVPAIILLRFTFGDQCWHNPNLGAGIVIDDPLLKKYYGFINFPQLLESARKRGYQVTLAFIPWNYWRSRPKQMQIFLNYSDCFAICAHGCDHTNNEFKSSDYERLLRKNFIASQRMEQHAKRTGLGWEPLMVCPQEQYSLEAMRAFADSRQFMGLVCTACVPRDLTSPQITGADLLLPAQDSFFGFPVFKRHYWKNDFSVFAMTLFLGKHAILVEHHEFFRNGAGGVEKFAEGLAKLRPGIQWKSLAETASRTHLRRRVSANRFEVRFFTDVFTLEHDTPEISEYMFVRRIPESTIVQRVIINEAETDFTRENGFLMFFAQAGHQCKIRVRIEVAPVKPARADSSGFKYNASVAVRRGLSEFRDNVIARNGFALRTSRLLAKRLRQTAN